MIDALKAELTELSARGLADAVSRAVRAGTVVPGQRLPSIRTVARKLNLSPTTVSAAWRLLARANLIHADGARGTVVADIARQGSARHRRALQYEARFDIDLSTGLPDPALLPDLAASLRRIPSGGPLESFLAEPIIPVLREHLEPDLPGRPELITMADGATDALDLIAITFLQFGDRVGVEHPSYPPLLDLLEAVHARVVPIDVDDSGPVASSVSDAVEAGVRAIYLQPRAQIPTGACLSTERAKEVASVLKGRDLFVVEFDIGWGIATAPLVSISDYRPELTIHIRAFAKSHGPDLRLAVVGGPAALLEPLIRRRHLGQGWTSRLLQRLLLDLLTHTAPVDQVNAARREYDRRRRAVVTELAGHGIQVGGSDGIVIWVPVDHEAVALMMLTSHGIGVAPGTPYMVRSSTQPHLAVTAGLLPVAQAPQVAAILAQAARPRSLRSVR